MTDRKLLQEAARLAEANPPSANSDHTIKWRRFHDRASPTAILSLLAALEAAEKDAERWRYARDYLSIEDIEAWDDMRPHTPDEAESLAADAAIDSLRKD